MAVAHNLTDPTNMLTCFDPVAGIVDGTTVGGSYILRKIFEALVAFDSDIKEITNAAPTPAFLQAEAGNLSSGVAMGQWNSGDLLRFYHASDPGLTQATPAAMIYEWRIANQNGAAFNLFNLRVYHKVSPSTIYSPIATGGNDILSNLGNTNVINLMAFQKINYGSTTTAMQNVCRVFFWRAVGVKGMFAVSKFDATFRGGYLWFNPEMTGYMKTGDALVQGLNFRHTAFLNANLGTIHIEGIYPTLWELNAGALVDGLTPLSSCGWPPEGLFIIGGAQRIIGAKMKLAIRSVNYMTVSDEIEGLLLANPSLVNGLIGTILSMNGNYYYLFNQISDVRRSYRVLLQLTTN